jgi:hypothetical protein
MEPFEVTGITFWRHVYQRETSFSLVFSDNQLQPTGSVSRIGGGEEPAMHAMPAMPAMPARHVRRPGVVEVYKDPAGEMHEYLVK